MRTRRWLEAAALGLAVVLGGPSPLLAQSQAINGTIEGTIKDTSGAVLPGVVVVLHNLDTGTERSVLTNTDGVYRAPLLPLGTYRITAELQGFKKYEQTGIRLNAGATIGLNLSLDVGNVAETVAVTADSPVVDLGKVDVGRNITDLEIKNLPNLSRNPYNLLFNQPGVSGTENTEFGVPRFSANGAMLRINYQVDGNTNTQKDRAGLRLLPMSEIGIAEVKVTTAGYAPEFGQTMGLVYNAITPSGTNRLRGDVSYRFRRSSFAAFPFFFQGPRTDETRPNNEINTWTATLGGPIVRDKVHYYAGFERTYRDMVAISTIDPAVAAAVGVPPQPQAVPAYQNVRFFLGKIDYTINSAHRLTGRYNWFQNRNPYNQAAGGFNAIERTADFADDMGSAATQLVSSLGPTRLNELRVQVAQRHQRRFANADAGTGPSINITNTINFGSPAGDGEDFKQRIFQVIDNFTLLRGNHNFKVGFDYQHVADDRGVPRPATFTFATLAAYQSAVSGANPFSYTNFSQVIGDPFFDMASHLFSTFVQDDWKATADFKLLYGVRYDYYKYPKARAESPFEYSRNFASDGNNLAPRVGVAWTIGERKDQVIRASTGLMHDQPLLAIYEQSLEQNGLPERTTVTLTPTTTGAPPFPNTLANIPPGAPIPAGNIIAPDPELALAYNFQNNVTYERSLGDKFSISVGFNYVRGYNLPVLTDINFINPTGTLADGRGIYNAAINPNTRMDPRFNRIQTVESVGESTYKGLIVTFGRRQADGVQFDFNYTFGVAEDNAPLTGTLGVQADSSGGRSDPVDLDRDRAPNSLDSRHTLNGNVIAMSSWRRGPKALQAVLSDNQIALVVQIASGLPFTVNSAQNINGIPGNDRPVFIGRNHVRLPYRWNVDARFSRFIPLGGSRRVEALAEFKNLFNNIQVSSVNSAVQVDAAGNPLVPIRFGNVTTTLTELPTDGSDYIPTNGYEQRKFQLGFKFYF